MLSDGNDNPLMSRTRSVPWGWVLVGVVLLGFVLQLMTGSERTEPQPVQQAPVTTATTLPGNAQVYADIANATDCRTLQAMFDGAEQTHSRPGAAATGTPWSEIGTSYMRAADERMRAIGCY